MQRLHDVQAVGHPGAHGFVVEDADDRRAARARSISSTTAALFLAAVERGGRFIQQQDRVVDDKAAGDVDALLLAAGKGRRGQGPQALRHVEPRQQFAGALFAAPARSTPRSSSGCITTSSAVMRGITRRNWLTQPTV